MKQSILRWLAGLAIVGLAWGARAGSLEEACALAFAQLRTVPSASLGQSTGSFTDEGSAYRGCVVRLAADRTKIKDAHYPSALFYPFAGSALHRQGWRADREADGPDGTAFRISRQGVFCFVRGNWDGGDDSDPTYVPSTRYALTVSCSDRVR